MIIALDPGPIQTACVVWDGEHIQFASILPNDHAAQFVYDHSYAKGAMNTIVACEHLQCFGMAVGATVFDTAYWVGEYRRLCKTHDIRFVRVMRSEVKMHFCHSMRAKDSNISQALRDRFGDKGTKKSPGLTYSLKKDLWSAFAIAAMTFDKIGGQMTRGLELVA